MTNSTTLKAANTADLKNAVRSGVSSYRNSAKGLVILAQVVVERYWTVTPTETIKADRFTPDVAEMFINEVKDMPRLQNKLAKIFKDTLCVKVTASKDKDESGKTIKIYTLKSNKKELEENEIETKKAHADSFITLSIPTLMDYDKDKDLDEVAEGGAAEKAAQLNKIAKQVKAMNKLVKEINPDLLADLLKDVDLIRENIETLIPNATPNATQEEIDRETVEIELANDENPTDSNELNYE